MSDIDEKLSVILDEYSDDEGCHSALNEVINDVNLQHQLHRYQMIGDVMRHELPAQISLDLNHKIMSRVRDIGIEYPGGSNAIESGGEKTSFWHWVGLKPLAGFAVAASVAIVSITLWQSISIETRGQSAETDNQVVSAQQKKINRLATLPVQGNAVTVSSSLNEGMRWQTTEDSPALQQKLNAYLVNHTEYSIPMQGLIPQARVAGFDSEQ